MVGEGDKGWGLSGATAPPQPLSLLGAGSCYQQVKRVLHAAVPDRLHARERETGVIQQFLREHICGRRPGSLYISGAPGTGKTACLSRVLLDCQVRWPGDPLMGVLEEQNGRERWWGLAGGARAEHGEGGAGGQRCDTPVPGRMSSPGAKPLS